MEKKIVKFAEEHPLRFVGLLLGITFGMVLAFTAVDIGSKELFRWMGGWPR